MHTLLAPVCFIWRMIDRAYITPTVRGYRWFRALFTKNGVSRG